MPYFLPMLFNLLHLSALDAAAAAAPGGPCCFRCCSCSRSVKTYSPALADSLAGSSASFESSTSSQAPMSCFSAEACWPLSGWRPKGPPLPSSRCTAASCCASAAAVEGLSPRSACVRRKARSSLLWGLLSTEVGEMLGGPRWASPPWVARCLRRLAGVGGRAGTGGSLKAKAISRSSICRDTEREPAGSNNSETESERRKQAIQERMHAW